MSQENVEVFKRAFDAINRRDAEALLAELDPEVEWHGAILMAMGGKQTVYRGHEGVREWLRDLYETLSEFQADYPGIRDLGDRTVAIGRVRARGAASEAEIEIASRHGGQVQERQGHSDSNLPQPQRSPRSRGPLGVGDVAGEAMTTASSHATHEIAILRAGLSQNRCRCLALGVLDPQLPSLTWLPAVL